MVLRGCLTTVILLVTAGVSLHATVIFTEGFDDITTLPGSGWARTNNSTPGGTTNWFQGNAGVFTSHSGATNSYISANFNAAPLGGNISDWLFTPVETIDNGYTLSFWTRTETSPVPGDLLQVRLSTNGASTNVGGGVLTVGDFTTLFGTVGEGPGGYPQVWTLFTATVSGLGGPTAGRFAFRYGVQDTSVNGDVIGIDDVTLQSPVPEPGTAGLLLIGLGAGFAVYRRSRRKSA